MIFPRATIQLSGRWGTRPIAAGLLLATLLATVLTSSSAQARSRGMAGVGCEGCHGEHENSSLSLSPIVAAPGTQTTLQFTISDPDAQVAGIFIEVEDTSALAIPGGQQLAIVFGGIAHTSPRAFSGGQVNYDVLWNVPSEPGATRFVVSSLSADGNGRNNEGDEGHVETFDVVYGCEPQTYYRDFDGDGYGQSGWTRIFCANSEVEGFAQSGDDCDDNSADSHPDADELCNRKDDDCDGEIDEDALPVELYPDADGDGFYSMEELASGEVVIGCLPYDGFADRGGDCAPDDPDVHPESEEVCEGRTDEDCDGSIDERVRPICGTGWCRRESYSCDISDCIVGTPREEICNFLDDDCDEEIDEGDLCPAGEQCLAGECRPAEIEGTGGGGGTPELGSGATGVGGGSESNVPDSPRESPSGSCGWGGRSRSPLPYLVLVSGALFVRRRRLRGLRCIGQPRVGP